MTKKYDVYVDGSWINGSIGYGAVIIEEGNVIAELSGNVKNNSVQEHRQVAGELEAVLQALHWCEKHHVEYVTIHYDYNGIKAWATGEWKAKKELTQQYARNVQKSCIAISWTKVAAHTGVTWNERADILAKQGTVKGVGDATKTEVASAPTPVAMNDLLHEAETYVMNFIAYLHVKGIEAEYDKIVNNMCARMLVKVAGERVGIVDIYNTKKKRLSPDYRAFKDAGLQKNVAAFWLQFLDKQGGRSS